MPDQPPTQAELQDLLALIHRLEILQKGNFTLAGGQPTNWYFDGRRLLLHPQGFARSGYALLPLVRAVGAKAVGGPATGAIPLAAALVSASIGEKEPPLHGFYTRPQPKSYGIPNKIAGSLPPGQDVAIVDDVCSTGESLFQAIQAAEDAGHPVVKVLTLVDRQEDGGDRLRQAGYAYRSLFLLDPKLGEIRIAPA